MTFILSLISPITSSIRWILQGRSSIAATLQTLLSRFLIIIINVLTGIITARALGPSGRGEQAAMLIWAGFLASALTLGLPASLVYNFKRFPERKSEFFSAALLLGTFLGIAASIIGIIFMPLWLAQYSQEVIRFSQWLMLNAPLCLLLLVCSAALEASGEFALANQTRCLLPFFTLLILLGLTLTGTVTPFTTSLAYVLSYIPIFIWILVRLWILFPPSWQKLGSSSKQLVSYGLRSYGIDLVGTLSLQIDQALVVGLLTPTAMGIYAVALSLSRMLNVFQNSIVTVLFPKTAARPPEEVVALTGQAARVSMALSVIAGIIVILLGPLLLQLLYGSEFLVGVTVFRILVIEVIFNGTIWVLAQAFMALGKPGIVTLLQSIGLGFSFPLMLFFIPAFGLVGAGLALLCSTTIRLIFILLSYPIILKLSPPSLLIKREDLILLKQKFLK